MARRKVWNGIPTALIKRRTSDINAASDIEICPRFRLIRRTHPYCPHGTLAPEGNGVLLLWPLSMNC